jgi:hypothetical protein
MKIEITEHLKSLLQSRNELAQQVNTEGVAILTAKTEADSNHNKECPCIKKTGECTDDTFKNAMGDIETRVATQKTTRDEIAKLDSLIGAGETVQDMELKSNEKFNDPNQPVTGLGMSRIAQDSLYPKKESFYSRLATNFHQFIHKNGIAKRDDVKSRPAIMQETLKTGEQFFGVASFHACFGANQSEVISTSKSVGQELGVYEGIEGTLKSARENYLKSMFTQHPLAGGDGSLYDPTAVFAGNTGGLCEFIIDDTIDVLPYPPLSFLDCIPVRRIPKSYVLYVRQTVRVNNASAVGESVTLGTDNPTSIAVDFRPLKPESEFGWTQGKAYTLTFADTIPVSEEFLEDCPAIADAVESQLMENVRQEFYDQIINGDGSDGEYPELLGLLAQVGLSTRVHQGAASFFGNTMGAGTVDDNIRETIVRAIFDAEAYGYTVDCILMSFEDYTQMYFLKDGNDKPLYTEAELNTIRGAKVRADVRMPAGTALVGAFRQVVQLLIRRAIRLDIGWVDKQFRQDMLTLRATLRGGLLVKAPHALIRVTGI